MLLFFSCALFTQVRAQFRQFAPINIPTSKCDFCLCSQGISPLEMGGSAVRYDVRYVYLDKIYQDGKLITNTDHHSESFFTNTLSLTYQVVPNLSATLLVPFAHKTETTDDAAELGNENGPNSLSNLGLSDISILARYNLLADHPDGTTRIFSATAGVKLATGNNNLTDLGQTSDPDLQLSTGTTDFLLGLGYLRGFEDWSFSTNLLAGLRGPGAGYAGHVYGNNLNYDITARYRIYPSDMTNPTIFAALGVRGEWRGYELQDGERIPDSGGDVTYVAPGVQIFFLPTLSLDASFWLPVIHPLNGTQIGESYKILSGIQYVF